MQLDKFIIGIIVFSLFITAGSLIIADVITTYEVNTTTDDMGFEEVYNVINESYDP